VNRQSGGEKLKYILKFYIRGTCHVIRACAMTTCDDTDNATAQQYSTSHSIVEKVNNVVSDDPEIVFKDTVHVPDTRRDLLSDAVDTSDNRPFR